MRAPVDAVILGVAVVCFIASVALWGWSMGLRGTRDMSADGLAACRASVELLTVRAAELDARIARMEEVEAWLRQWWTGPLQASEDGP